jgi:enoyl-[acyl-carrier protein] reductase III
MVVNMEKILKDKIALVTGSSRGIGRAIALKLADLGCDLVINYKKNLEAAEDVVRQIHEKGRRAVAINADIGEHEEVKVMFENIRENFGRLDILINNAAFGALGPAMRIGRLTWNMTMNLNTGGLLLCTQQAVKLMPEGGRIVNISSLGSRLCIPDYMPVGTAKAAIEAMTRYLACELIERGIYVNAVSAGFIDTEALDIFKDIENLKDETVRRTPAGRLGTAEDVARVVAFLCQEDSNWILGQTIIADGGASLRF